MGTVAVIGGGPNGLAAAIQLADAGASVTLFEARDTLGGRAASEEFHPGFHTSGVLHDSERVQPWVVDRLKLRKHGLSTMAVPTVVGVGHDGATVLLPSDVNAAVAALDGTQASLGTQWRRWHDEVSLVGRVLAALSAKAPPDIGRSASIWSLLGAAMPALRLGRNRLIDLTRVAPLCASDWLDEWFRHPLLQSTLTLPALLGTWMGPRSPTGAMALLLHHGLSGDSIVGGPAGLVSALSAAAATRKIDIHTGCAVAQIDCESAFEVELGDGTRLATDRIVSALGVRKTLLGLVDPRHLPVAAERAAQCVRSRGIVAKVDLALSGPLPVPGRRDAAYSRIRIAPDPVYLERAFDDAKHRRMPAAPALDIRVPSLEQPGLAPEGHHVASVLVYGAAHDLDGGWDDAARAQLEQVVRDTLERFLPGSTACIVAARTRTPADLEQDLGLDGGHLFHAEVGLDQILSFRPHPLLAHYTTPIPGLVLAGAGMHPAGGLTCAQGVLAAQAAAGR